MVNINRKLRLRVLNGCKLDLKHFDMQPEKSNYKVTRIR